MKLPLLARISLVVIIGGLFACKKDKENELQSAVPACKVIKTIRSDSSYSAYQYNATQQLTSIFYHIAKSQSIDEINETNSIERDANNRIVKLLGTRSDGVNGSITTIDYDSKVVGLNVPTLLRPTPLTPLHMLLNMIISGRSLRLLEPHPTALIRLFLPMNIAMAT